MSFLNIMEEGMDLEGAAGDLSMTERLARAETGSSGPLADLKSALDLDTPEQTQRALENLNKHFTDAGVDLKPDSFNSMTEDQKSAYGKIAQFGEEASDFTPKELTAIEDFESGSKGGGEFNKPGGTEEPGVEPKDDAAETRATEDAASGTGDIKEEPPEVAEDIAGKADSNAANEKTGSLSKAKAAAGVLTGGAAITLAIFVGYGIDKGSNSDNPDDCDALPAVAKQSCKNTIAARAAYHEMIEGFNNAMDNLFDFANLLGLYGIFGLFVFILFLLIIKIIKKSLDKKIGGVILYGLILIFVSSCAIPFGMWFFRSPRQNCTKPTNLATVDSTCSLLLQSGSCFRSSPNELDTYSLNPCIKKSFISSPTYLHPYNILINGERANNSLNYVEMYDPNDLPWEWKFPIFQENSQCQYYKHGSPIPLSSPPQITCSSPTSPTDIDNTSVGSYRGEPDDLLLYPRIATGIVFGFVILCLIYSWSYKSADSQAKEYLKDHPGAKIKIDSKAEWKQSVEEGKRGKIMQKLSDIEQAGKEFDAKGLAEMGREKIMQKLSDIEQAGKEFDAKGLAKTGRGKIMEKLSKVEQSVKALRSGSGENQTGGFLNTKKFKKINKYNKWLIVFLIIFAMIITHFYKKQRGIQKDQQYLQQLKQKRSSKQKINNNFKNDSEVQAYQPDNVFNGQYL